GQMTDAVDLLGRALSGRSAELPYETRIVALLLLPVALVFSGRLADAEAGFERAIDLAEGAEDWPHVCQIFINRAMLWGARKDLPRALDDMTQAVRLAREIGNPFLERQASINVAEMLLWEGRRGEALSLARRALLLDQRLLGRPATESSLITARILVTGD